VIRVCPKCGWENTLPTKVDPKSYVNPPCAKCGADLFPRLDQKNGLQKFKNIFSKSELLIKSTVAQAKNKAKSLNKKIDFPYLKAVVSKYPILIVGALLLAAFVLGQNLAPSSTTKVTQSSKETKVEKRYFTDAELAQTFRVLSKNDQLRFQKYLKEKGFYRGRIDAQWGPQTKQAFRFAVNDFQRIYEGDQDQLLIVLVGGAIAMYPEVPQQESPQIKVPRNVNPNALNQMQMGGCTALGQSPRATDNIAACMQSYGSNPWTRPSRPNNQNPASCRLEGEQTDRFNKICYYSCITGRRAMNVGITEICPHF